ncbi:MAG TPA: hypothetical protein VL094_13915 [Sphingomonadaceae bacterium]|nr:hypothetical protein [Sphingomonadaceae bacterium]
MHRMLNPAAPVLAAAFLAACGQGDGAKAAPGPEKSAQAEAGSKTAGLLASLVTPRQKGPYAPRDECSALKGAQEFRIKLAKAVLARDADAFVGLAAPDILLDFGGGEGKDELRRRLADKDYNLWEALQNLLPLGCAVNGQSGMTMPWYFAQDFGDRDSYMLLTVRGEGVPILAEPRAGAKVLKTLDWNIVELQESTDEGSPFAKVHDYDGTAGYMAWDKLRALVDYRLIVEERQGSWVLSAFVAGD